MLRVAPGATPYPELMNGAVVDEMLELDPDVVVVKGDLTDTGRAEEYEAFLACYGRLGDRLRHVRGNHDAMRDPELARRGRAVRGAPRRGRARGARHRGARAGRGRAAGGAARLARRPGRRRRRIPCSCSRTTRATTTTSDYGLPLADHEALLAVVARRENIVGYLAGHTHTNRVVRYAPTGAVPFVEVACTKDYPGAWAEYRIYEGGYTQVMRRVAAPEAREWSELGRTMIQGIYRDLVLGTLADRCFAHQF